MFQDKIVPTGIEFTARDARGNVYTIRQVRVLRDTSGFRSDGSTDYTDTGLHYHTAEHGLIDRLGRGRYATRAGELKLSTDDPREPA